jgi:signal transduction histidine kinase/HD-like signal output (HDOD) protein/ActR/RegA family two-component response regulator
MDPKFTEGPTRFQEEIRDYVLGLRQLESLPAVALRVIDLAGDDRSSRDDITRLIESDSSLAARVLSVANSAWLGYPGKIGSLDRAMALLGFEMVRNIALSVLVSHFFFKQKSGHVLRLEELWNHSLACAVACEQIARRRGYRPSGAAFVAGLLHDLGKVVLVGWNRELYDRLARVSQEKRTPLHQIEAQVLGTDHAAVGRMLLEDWCFPGEFAEAAGDHHRVDDGSGLPPLAALVKWANSFCHHKRFGYSGHSQPDLSFPEILAASSLTEEGAKEVAVEIIRRFDEVASLFTAEPSAPDLYLAAVARANQELADMYQKLVERTREQELAEKALRQKEEELNRAQRLEAVGQLAGGIAHDFNNFLTVIMGFGDLLREGLPQDSPLQHHVDTIMSVGERAATLTRQLLAFSRRQVLRPKVLILNAVVSDVQRLLVRLIGEDVKLTTVLDPSLRPVRVDPGSIENVIVNLAVNARDAMMDGGVLTIETSNVELKRASADPLVKMMPGPYVLLQISDTGHGMTRETQERIFEPFFTTKRRGTGMGLATVYGIVKQSGGYVAVESKVGRGTTFKIFFAPVDQEVDADVPHPVVEMFENGSETVLIAEDEKEILDLVERILKNVGYHVITARNGEEALNAAGNHQGAIHLLLTDAVMPVLNGRELVERLRPQRPNMKVLFMSGYTGTGLLHRAVAGQDIAFIAKPFTPNELLQKIQQLLEED